MQRIFLALLVLLPAAALGQPGIAFEEGAVRVSGLSPGTSVVVFAASLERPDVYVRVVRRQHLLSDDDRDGEVRLDLLGEVPPHSVWAAVDVSTGSAATAVPQDAPLRRRETPKGAVQHAHGGVTDSLSLPEPLLELLLVRPGVGAWRGGFAEGTPTDGDGTGDGWLRMQVSQLAPWGHSASAPIQLVTGDVLVAVNPETLAVYTLTVKEGA
ncbi:MAG: hypothetical protein AB2L07_11400 [Thermoanaerobaculaceae bacterium]